MDSYVQFSCTHNAPICFKINCIYNETPTCFEINSAAITKTKCKPAFPSNGNSIDIPSIDSQGVVFSESTGEETVWKSRGRLEFFVRDFFEINSAATTNKTITGIYDPCPLWHTFWGLLRRDYPRICSEKRSLEVRKESWLVFKHIFWNQFSYNHNDKIKWCISEQCR